MRICARALLLSTRGDREKKNARARHDDEGVDDIDLEASSSREWTEWKKKLSTESRRLLAIWRGGAVSTPTRRAFGREAAASASPLTACPWCAAEMASARHLWAECRHFNAMRAQLQREHHMQASWWQNQPKITSKSGWITLSAARSPQKRASLQVAACRLGIRICEDLGQLRDEKERGGTWAPSPGA